MTDLRDVSPQAPHAPEAQEWPHAPEGPEWPRVTTAGFDGFVVRFGDALSEAANRAALAFRAAVDLAGWPAVAETSTSLVSTYLRFDPLGTDHAVMRRQVQSLLATQDWYAAALPQGRRLWRVPTVFGTGYAPQLDEAAARAGLTAAEAIRQIAATRLRVQTIGFAPGQPYLGELPPAFDIPRQTELTPEVPEGAVVVAIRQIVLFSVTTPTGWRHIGQTRFRLFRPDADDPFVLRPGDEVLFEPISPERYSALAKAGPDGGALSEALK
ncbi:allophanate hydrolase subunit 1 [Phaeobacter sp. B1627]|uniref:5-oxoprolinase subunit B family protein n=1 Tax=Phaeobacter sp. B1627 TaxID=2583809 RepID=UPI00111B5DA1|nr:carboxyltransferase domain-containing protein [Phaeobacter sp. B1627]TNJ40559.1 allophanate hydrolase subunit 1 [Phaeobacter sp. B1627]